MRYVRLLLLALLLMGLAAPLAALAQAGDADGDGVADDADACPAEPASPGQADPDRPGCPLPEQPAGCLVDFAGSQTFTWPSYRAPAKNPAATPGRYSATARTSDSLWWLLQGTDWVQAVPVTGGDACGALPAFAPIPDATCGPATSHVVQPGQTLATIAQRYGSAVGPIATANLIANPDLIEVGQTLVIPCPAPPTAVPPTAVPPTATPPTAEAAAAPPDAPALALPTIPITTASVAGVELLFAREFIGYPYDLHLFASGLDETLSFVTDGGLVIFYSLVAPETMPGSMAGTDQRIYQYAATRDEALAAAEPNAAGGSTVFLEGPASLRDSRLDIPIPLEQGGRLADLALTPRLLVTTSGARTDSADAETGVRLWELAAGGAPPAFIAHDAPVTGVAVSPDAGLLASAALDGTVRVWDLNAPGGPALRAQFNDGAQGVAALNGGSSLAFSPDNRLLAVGGSDGFARLWVIASGELLAKLPHGAGSQVLAAAFSLDGSVLATGGGIHPATVGGPFLFQDTTVYLWDVAALQDGAGAVAARPAGPWKLDGHLDTVTGLAFSADGAALVSLSADGSFRIWGVRAAPQPVG